MSNAKRQVKLPRERKTAQRMSSTTDPRRPRREPHAEPGRRPGSEYAPWSPAAAPSPARRSTSSEVARRAQGAARSVAGRLRCRRA